MKDWKQYTKEEWILLSEKEQIDAIEEGIFPYDYRKAREEFENIVKEILLYHESKMPDLIRCRDIMRQFGFQKEFYSISFLLGSVNYMQEKLYYDTTLNDYFKANIERHKKYNES